MKIFIYDEFLDESLQQFNLDTAAIHRQEHHLQYWIDFTDFFAKYRTFDPNEAHYFYVPLYLTGWQFANIDPEELILKYCKYLDRGNHIILSTGDVGQRVRSQYDMPEGVPGRAYDQPYKWLDERFSLIVLESINLWPRDIAFLPYQHQEIAYPNEARDILISFLGKLTQLFLPPSHIRGGKLIDFKNKFSNANIVIGAPEEFPQFTYHSIMARSFFTLCPAGIGRWSFRFLEALLNGSIPILLSDDYVLPFSKKIKWDDYCLVIPERDLERIPEIVSGIPFEQIYQKLKKIKEDRHFFTKEFSLHEVAEMMEQNLAQDGKISYADLAIRRMRSPEHMHIICVDVTNKCDLACSNCTRLLENQDKFWEMSPENFREALRSLKNYNGVIAMIGGNPCMHTKFEELCKIFIEEVPNQIQRGLWTNNYFKHRKLVEETFGSFNLNPHNNPRAIEPLKDLHQTVLAMGGRNAGYYDKNSDHAPLLTAIKDIYDEREMWDKISACDINREWSAAIVQNNGKLRAYFCEVAASFDLARNEDHGHEVVLDWWKNPIDQFEGQIKRFCPGCGAAAKIKGHFDYENIDTYTKTNEDLALKSVAAKKRKVIMLNVEEHKSLEHKVTNYANY